MSKTKTCIHCAPLTPLHHRSEFIESWILMIMRPLERIPQQWPFLHRLFHVVFLEGMIRALLWLKILHRVVVQEQGTILNRSWLMFHEAQKRGACIERLYMYHIPTSIFHYTSSTDAQGYFFEMLPFMNIRRYPLRDIDDKEELRTMLHKASLPSPQGRAFRSIRQGIKYGLSLSFPLVVKPRSGSHSRHTIMNITDESSFHHAVIVAKEISAEYVVEEFLAGDVYRVLMIDGKVAAVARRLPPSVIGDGIHTIAELIKQKNNEQHRGPVNDPHFTLHTISIDETLHEYLRIQHLHIHHVPKLQQRTVLGEKIMLAMGADIEDCTDVLHPDTGEMFVRAADLCGASIVGFDFICRDIALSYHVQSCGIIEANTLPYIDMHHFPTYGSSRNVAATIIDYVEKKFIKMAP